MPSSTATLLPAQTHLKPPINLAEELSMHSIQTHAFHHHQRLLCPVLYLLHTQRPLSGYATRLESRPGVRKSPHSIQPLTPSICWLPHSSWRMKRATVVPHIQLFMEGPSCRLVHVRSKGKRGLKFYRRFGMSL